ncbi:hypothetical protein TRIATDRAFT_298730 [Trichoderma atroviride IMI 206040]|uniref:Uncharacterized protein n=1 Tax=Hypocrea atroviridis (strain ATCC 20476 / IMI 206040) TaxID=452589 RepID=G9NNW6_HYPAI|nr:uncharacterized protein TRIATDRAFT_298730 [Trichoderma atroviride IMI 206040]EHK47753.1 hypothetical protein TRIATDRAFT_298730 [Trichoderma atroviride IMI 206040]
MFAPVLRVTKALKPQTAALSATFVFAGIAGGAYSYRIYNRFVREYQTHVRQKIGVLDSLNNSNTVRTLVNPHNHVTMGDSCSTILTTLPEQETPSDEVILSALVKGFFSGPVFMPERIALRLIGLRFVTFDGLEPTAQPIWKTSQLSSTQLPMKTAILWGCFQIANIELSNSKDGDNRSVVDIVFGTDREQFAGCHRFSVKRVEENSHAQKQPAQFQVQVESIICNPTVNKPISISFLGGFHKVYANLLFRDAVAEAMHPLSLNSA